MRYLNGLLVLAQEGEHAEEPSGTALILPEMAELLWGAVAFGVVFFVLNKFAFPALRKQVEAREKKIQEDLEQAESSKHEAQRQLDQYKKQVAEARGEANRIIEEARQQAEQVRKDLVAKAEKEAEGIVARAQEQLAAERARTVTELQQTIGDLSIELAEKVVGRSIDATAQRDFVDAYIREVAASGAGARNN
ncbi:MAG: F0F1 ATP synthase subunit B [Actinomycetota bacterium]|nr:F0F1 ATP synthase subunit B [Actinomycetota bacterium]